MVECEGARLRKGDPRRGLRIVVTDGMSRSSGDEERDGGGRLPRVPVRSGVDSYNPTGAADEARLFPELADDGLLDRFLELDKSARQSPPALERRPAPAHEEDPSSPDPDRVDGQCGTLVTSSTHPREEVPAVLGVTQAGARAGPNPWSTA